MPIEQHCYHVMHALWLNRHKKKKKTSISTSENFSRTRHMTSWLNRKLLSYIKHDETSITEVILMHFPALSIFQGIHSSRSWIGCRILGFGRWIRYWNCWWCWCERNRSTATIIRRYDFDPDFRWSIGSLWLDCGHLLIHQISENKQMFLR